jgi:hypothetical protein
MIGMIVIGMTGTGTSMIGIAGMNIGAARAMASPTARRHRWFTRRHRFTRHHHRSLTHRQSITIRDALVMMIEDGETLFGQRRALGVRAKYVRPVLDLYRRLQICSWRVFSAFWGRVHDR